MHEKPFLALVMLFVIAVPGPIAFGRLTAGAFQRTAGTAECLRATIMVGSYSAIIVTLFAIMLWNIDEKGLSGISLILFVGTVCWRLRKRSKELQT